MVKNKNYKKTSDICTCTKNNSKMTMCIIEGYLGPYNIVNSNTFVMSCNKNQKQIKVHHFGEYCVYKSINIYVEI